MKTNNPVLSLRMYLFFFHSSSTVLVGFLPLFFKAQGLTASQIGWMLAIGPMISMVTQPIGGYLSDKYKTVKKILLICILAVLTSGAILFQLQEFTYFMIVGLIFFGFSSPLGALADSLTQTTATLQKVSFGSIRTFGSIGFAVASLIGGVIVSAIGIHNVGYVFLVLLTVALVTLLKVQDVSLSKNPVAIFDTFKLFRHKQLMTFFGLMLFVAITHRANDSYLGIFLESLGGNEQLIGMAWFVAVIAEAIVFATSRRWMDRFKSSSLMIFASVMFSIRWFLFGSVSSPMLIVVLQVMHGLSFGIFYTCAFDYVSRLLPRDVLATGHMLFIMIFFGFSGIIGSLLGGIILENFGSTTLYFIMGGMSFIGALALYAYTYRTDRAQMIAIQTR